MTAPARGADLADLASMLADRTRATFCLALLDGRAWTASELGAVAQVAPATTSQHLDKLITSGLLVQRRQGRHRYVELAGAHVAELLESLVAHLEPAPVRPRSLRAANAAAALARGRTCYDHLAGRLGVAITDAMARTGRLDTASGFALTDVGTHWFASALGIPATDLSSTRRPVARECLDWTERRSHLAGAAGARLCTRLHDKHWITPVRGSRAVRVTPEGRVALRQLLDIDADALALI